MKNLKKTIGKWLCEKMGWHKEPTMKGFDGCSFNGNCPRCGSYVLQDSRGNWFTPSRDREIALKELQKETKDNGRPNHEENLL